MSAAGEVGGDQNGPLSKRNRDDDRDDVVRHREIRAPLVPSVQARDGRQPGPQQHGHRGQERRYSKRVSRRRIVDRGSHETDEHARGKKCDHVRGKQHPTAKPSGVEGMDARPSLARPTPLARRNGQALIERGSIGRPVPAPIQRFLNLHLPRSPSLPSLGDDESPPIPLSTVRPYGSRRNTRERLRSNPLPRSEQFPNESDATERPCARGHGRIARSRAARELPKRSSTSTSCAWRRNPAPAWKE